MSGGGERSKRQTLLHVDLKELKAPWNDWCSAHNLTPSEAVRHALANIMRSGFEAPTLPSTNTRSKSGLRRVEMRIPRELYLAAVNAARQDGISTPRWLRAVLIAYIENRPQLGPPEVQALTRSNQALFAIARALHRVIRQDPVRLAVDELSAGQVAFLIDLIKTHRTEVSQMLNDNARRWKL